MQLCTTCRQVHKCTLEADGHPYLLNIKNKCTELYLSHYPTNIKLTPPAINYYEYGLQLALIGGEGLNTLWNYNCTNLKGYFTDFSY